MSELILKALMELFAIIARPKNNEATGMDRRPVVESFLRRQLNEDLVYEPRIAKSWEVSADGLALTFHLQPCQWSDGHPLTAHDVVSSFDLFPVHT